RRRAQARGRVARRTAPRPRRLRGRLAAHGERQRPRRGARLEPGRRRLRAACRRERRLRLHPEGRAVGSPDLGVVGMPPTERRRLWLRWGTAALAAAGVVAALGATSDHDSQKALNTAIVVVVGLSFVSGGLAAWSRRPENRTGRLL